MKFGFKFDKLNIIQFFITLMIVFPSDGIEHRFDFDCVIVGSHNEANGKKCDEINWEKPEEPMPFPWKVTIKQFSGESYSFEIFCDGILISNKHVLAAASCILKGQGLVNLEEIPSIPFTIPTLPIGESAMVSKLYVHENYSNSTHDFDISIIELEETVNLYPPFIYPAILPRAPLAFHHGNQLHVAIAKGLSENYFQRVNASIWSKDECAPNEDHLICIETDSDCDNLEPSAFLKQNISPIFYVAEWGNNANGKKEILGLPMGCKRIDSPISKSALVYLRVADFLPWIQNIIFNGGAKCVDETPNIQDAFVFENVEPNDSDKIFP